MKEKDEKVVVCIDLEDLFEEILEKGNLNKKQKGLLSAATSLLLGSRGRGEDTIHCPLAVIGWYGPKEDEVFIGVEGDTLVIASKARRKEDEVAVMVEGKKVIVSHKKEVK